MVRWPVPQSSAHWPRNVWPALVLSIVNSKRLVWPGMTSRLNRKRGTYQAWMTSGLRWQLVVARLAAVANDAPDDEPLDREEDRDGEREGDVVQAAGLAALGRRGVRRVEGPADPADEDRRDERDQEDHHATGDDR